ncbi:MAG: PBP1A family penicillin-binding protein [Bacillota bacterium]|nr:PBP1A family penicillin-binding protein [Bacillota bacterium]
MADQYQSREERRKQQTAKSVQKSKKKPGGLVKKILLTIVALGVVGMLAGVATFAYLIKDAPKLNPKLLKDPIASKILDKDGQLITEVGAQNRDYVAYKDIPKVVEDAFLATEDYRFYQHHGIDFIRLGGALLANVQHGFGSEGASTITEQVVKNSILGPQKTVKRKIEEAWLAYQLEQKYTKHQILEMYLNKIYFSENANGVATAAKAYYGKDLKNLTLPEAAMLAGLPQSPNNYNPFNHADLAINRRNIVLSLMYQHGYISKSEMENAKAASVTADLVKDSQRAQNEKPYDPFIDAVIDEVKKAGDFDIYNDGLTIYTTLDKNAQLYVDKILNTSEIVKYPDDKFQAGVALLDTKTGEIRAIGGGRNQQVSRGFNYAIDTQRQPGSTIKPVLDYGPAIEYLNWGTYQMIDDKPVKYSTGKTFGNWDNKYMGPMTIRTALQLSRNTPAVQTLQQVGLERAKGFAVNLGIPLKDIYESYAIGGFTHGVSPLEMAGAYSAFGNKGLYNQPHAVRKIVLRDGTEIKTAPETKVAMKESTAFMITDMLKSVLHPPGTGVKANIPWLPVAGKTGTTNYTDQEIRDWNIDSSKAVPDAWFTGYTTNYTTSVWTGYSSRQTPIEPGDNQKIAQYIFKSLMEYMSKDISTPDFTVPSSVQAVKIEKGTMPPKLAGAFTPPNEVLTEYAVKGHALTDVSVKYNKLDPPSSPSATYDQANNQIVLSWNYNDIPGKTVQFDVSASLDGGLEQKLSSSSEKGLKISNPTPGGKYLFKIVATSASDTSDPATVSIEIPNPAQNNQNGQSGNNQNGTGGTTPPATSPDGSGSSQNGGTNSGGGTNTGTGGTGTGSGGTGTGSGGTGTGSGGTGTGSGGTGTGSGGTGTSGGTTPH